MCPFTQVFLHVVGICRDMTKLQLVVIAVYEIWEFIAYKSLRPAKNQTSLHMPVWTEPLLFALCRKRMYVEDEGHKDYTFGLHCKQLKV